jgi:hypothetical protein
MRLRWKVLNASSTHHLRQFGCGCGVTLNDSVPTSIPSNNDGGHTLGLSAFPARADLQ